MGICWSVHLVWLIRIDTRSTLNAFDFTAQDMFAHLDSVASKIRLQRNSMSPGRSRDSFALSRQSA